MEVSMPIPNAREILKSENQMLEALEAKIAEFAKNYKDLEAANLECWALEFSRYRDINNQYLAMDDQAFDKALKEESSVLESLKSSITSQSDRAKYWKWNLDENAKYTNALLTGYV
jgi:hypothetical protein